MIWLRRGDEEIAWGWGALAVDSPGKGWPCPHCGRKARKHDGRHLYLFGEPRCTACAEAWCRANGGARRPSAPPRLGQLSLDDYGVDDEQLGRYDDDPSPYAGTYSEE